MNCAMKLKQMAVPVLNLTFRKLIHYKYFQIASLVYLKPLIPVLLATISITASGMFITWTSPILPQLTSPDSPIGTTITNDEAAWIAASPLIAVLPGGLLTFLLIEKFGRKTILLLSVIPIFIPWIVCAFAESAMTIIIARVLAGTAGTAIVTAVPMYISETAEKDIRGKLGTTINILKLLGQLYVYSVGPFVSYKAFTLSCAAFPLLFGICFFFMPESPYYLVKIGNKEAAERNLIRLCYNNIDRKKLDDHLNEIAKTVDYDMKNRSNLWELVSKYEYRKPLLIMFGIKTFQAFNGLTVVNSYTQTIIESTNSSISPKISSIICGFVQIPAALVAAALVDKMGRKPLLIISLLGCAITLITEGVYFYLQDVVQADTSSISWLPTTALMLYLIMNPIGIDSLPYVLMGELFATNIKGIALAVVILYSGLLSFVTVIMFEPILSTWGMYTAFWLFGGMCILGSLFVLFVLPETKGKTFTEIQQKMNRGRIAQSSNL